MKRPSSLTLVNLGLLLLLGAGIVHDSRAQSFGDFLKNAAAAAAADAARQAVGNNVRQAVTGAVDGVAKGLTQPSAQTPAQPQAPVAELAPANPGCARRKGAPLPIGERPASFQPAGLWPENTAVRCTRSPT